MDDLQEIKEDFLVEAFEMIEQLDQDLVELESNPEDLDLLNRIFRVAHTIKGSSSFLNFDILTRLTHNMEDVLNKARRDELKITPDVMDVVLHSIDLMKALLVAIRDNGTDANSGIEIDDTVVRLQAISNGGAPTAEDSPAPAPQWSPHNTWQGYCKSPPLTALASLEPALLKLNQPNLLQQIAIIHLLTNQNLIIQK